MAIALVLSAVFSAFTFSANAAEVTSGDVRAYYEAHSFEVALAGYGDSENDFRALFEKTYAPSQEAGVPYAEIKKQLEVIVVCAQKRNKLNDDYPENEYVGEEVDGKVLGNKGDLINVKKEAFAKLVVGETDLDSEEHRQAAIARYQEVYEKANAKLDLVPKAFQPEKEAALKEINNDYKRLTKVTASYKRNNSEDDYQRNSERLAKEIPNLYTLTHFNEISDVKKEYDDKIVALEYDFSVDNGVNKEKADSLAREAIAKMRAVPHNDFDVAYTLYEKYKNARDNGNEYDESAAMSEAIEPCRNAVDYFYPSTSDEFKAEYQYKYEELKNFLKEADYSNHPSVSLSGVSRIEDANGIITVTARYASDDSVAKALPVRGVVKIANVRNGAAKRNASAAIRKLNEKLGVSYFVYISVTDGTKADYKLPETHVKLDSDGKVIKDWDGSPKHYELYYTVEIDLEKYYEYTQSPTALKEIKEYRRDGDGKIVTDYNGDPRVDSITSNVSNANYDKNQQDKLTNITNGLNTIKNAEGKLSLCYSYEYGKDMIENNLVTTADLEGGTKLMFITSKLGMFCVAGAESDNLLLNPLLWVGVLAAVIILIIVIKILLKQVRYNVKFVTDGGTPVNNVRAAKNEYFVMPSAPVKDGFVFGGWYCDKDCTSRFIDTYMRRRRGFKVYAKWVAPVSSEKLAEYYDELVSLMNSYEKTGYKAGLGLTENKRVASLVGGKNCLTLHLALNAQDVRRDGYSVETDKSKQFADVPVKIIISTKETFVTATELVKRALVESGMQLKKDFINEAKASTAEERAIGFELVIKNDRVAQTAEDYFELLRVAVKSYVLEKDNGKFKHGDKFTFARAYIVDGVTCLYLASVKSVKELATPEVEPRFADTPVQFKILTAQDVEEAYGIIDKLMTSFGFVKDPEAANDLKETEVPATCGFAYTIKF